MSTEEFLVSGAEKIRNGIVNSNKYKTTRTNLEKLINDICIIEIYYNYWKGNSV